MRTKAEYQALLREHGSGSAIARALGLAERTVQRDLKALGIARPASVPREKFEPTDERATLTQENAELRRALARARETQTRDERVLQFLEEHVEAKVPRYEPAEVTDAKGHRPHEFVLLWSDLHAAERVFADQVHNLNEYTWDIMLERHDKLRKSTLSFLANRPYPVPALRILGLGDMVSGDIHDELRETNEKVLIETALQLGLDMAEWIESFVPHFERITLDGVVGNHGRTTRKPQAKNAFSNFDWMFYHILGLRLAKHPSIEVNVPKSPYEVVEVAGRKLFIWHGDGVRSTMPGVPWGGLVRRTNELRKTYEPAFGHIDHFICGHFHEPNVVSNKSLIVNGSIKGIDEYSLKAFGGGADATQLLLVFNDKYGLTEPAYLDLQGRVIT